MRCPDSGCDSPQGARGPTGDRMRSPVFSWPGVWPKGVSATWLHEETNGLPGPILTGSCIRAHGGSAADEWDAQAMTTLSLCRPSISRVESACLNRHEACTPWGGNQAIRRSGDQGFEAARLPSCRIAQSPRIVGALVPPLAGLAVDIWVYRRGWSRRKTIWVGRTNRRAMRRRLNTMAMYIMAIASTE